MTEGAEHVFGGRDPAQHMGHDLPSAERRDDIRCGSPRHAISTDRYQLRLLCTEKRAVPAILGVVLTLLLSACDPPVSGYNEPRGYDGATLKLVFSMDWGQCLNRFTYDSKLAPSAPGVVPCDSPDARIPNDGFHANAPGCGRIDYESITQDGRAYYCLKYLVRVGYCYPALISSTRTPAVLLYAPSACDESLPLPRVAVNLVADSAIEPPKNEFSRFAVTDIKSPGPGQHCDSISVDLEPPEEVEGPGIPPAISQLVCLAP